MAFGRVVRVGHGGGCRRVGGYPLVRAGRAFAQLPLVAKQGFEIAVVPLDRGRRPRAFDAAGGGVARLAAAETVVPAKTLLLDGSAFGLTANQRGVTGTMRLAEGMAAGDQRHGFRSEEHTSELQSLMRISYAVFCLQKKKNNMSPH